MFNFVQEKGIANSILILIIIILIAIMGVGWYFFSEWKGEEKKEGEVSEVEVKETFVNKIVYTTDQEKDVNSFKDDCSRQGGTFNECGTICGPGVDVCANVCAYTCEFENIDLSEWEVYKNSEYGFKLKYPYDWNMMENLDDPIGPAISFYIKPAGVPVSDFLDHFANINHVSVYPDGIPTEGVVGETEEVSLTFNSSLSDSSKLYLLEDENPFAAYLQFKNSPEAWKDPGFAWARLQVDNLEEKCLRDSQEISMDQCDPFANDDMIVRKGSVDKDIWEKQKAIIRSIKIFPAETAEEKVRLDMDNLQDDISSPLTITGEAKGTWYFEANFPVVLTNWDGEIIAEAVAQAQDDWMTEDFVPFEATLEFEDPYQEGDPDFMRRGNLILQKANPSGLPENDDAYEIPVYFE